MVKSGASWSRWTWGSWPVATCPKPWNSCCATCRSGLGIEASIVQYVEDSRSHPNTAAFHNGEIVGVCVVQHHTRGRGPDRSARGPARTLHRHGIGWQLVEAVEVELPWGRCQVAASEDARPVGQAPRTTSLPAPFTSPSVSFRSRNAPTSGGPENPCLICVKPLS